MFDSKMIGNYIAFLRKRMKLTQAQLAEELGVSHQAVSNWERGEAMPDIGLLQNLARILATTVDRMLAAGDDDSEEQTPNNRASSETLSESLPETVGSAHVAEEKNGGRIDNMEMEKQKINEHEQRFDQGYEQVRMYVLDNRGQTVEAEATNKTPLDPGIGIDWKKIRKLAPFTSHEVLDRLIKTVIAKSGDDPQISLKEIRRLAPFLSVDTLDMLVDYFIGGTDWDTIIYLAPFLRSETLERLTKELDSETNFNILLSLAPFLKSEALDNLVEKLNETTDFDKITALAPFLNNRTIEKLIMSALD